jgi:hypothetical protein
MNGIVVMPSVINVSNACTQKDVICLRVLVHVGLGIMRKIGQIEYKKLLSLS